MLSVNRYFLQQQHVAGVMGQMLRTIHSEKERQKLASSLFIYSTDGTHFTAIQKLERKAGRKNRLI